MSVLIKGMEMPKSCDMCWALDDYGDYPRCRITEEQRGYNFPVREQRMSKCPLVPVPPHGRLIDADALIDDMANMIPWAIESPEEIAMVDGLSAGYEAVKAAPTIIPAEPSEEQREYEAQVEAVQYCEMYEPTYDPETGAL